MLTHVLRLHWAAPVRTFPHGLTGVASLGIGACLIAAALSGNLQAASHPAALSAYVVAGVANALAGLVITGRAPRKYRPAFRLCALFQCGLIYFVWRFSPAFPLGGSLIAATIDTCMAVLLLVGIIGFAVVALAFLPLFIAVAVVMGSAALALLAGYPLQLAYLGQEWFECVQMQYPLQGAAMVAYIYVPATWAFALMLFGATLWSRHIIGDIGLGGGFAAVVAAVLVTTVLMQEVHFPEPASTQKLWLPCPRPPSDSWSAWVEVHLDTSALARTALSVIRRHCAGWGCV